MKKKIILRLSNEIGNQMFMYASALSISKKMNRELLLDDETAFLLNKNISKYGLNNFNISTKIADEKFKFKNIKGYIKRKFLLKIDFFKKKKSFYKEPKNNMKISSFNDNLDNNNYSDVLFFEGHFESEKYFIDYKDIILNEFNFLNYNNFIKNNYYNKIINSNSVGICIRQNRFNEGKGKNNEINLLKSQRYTNEQIVYINKSVSIIKKKVGNPVFYIWSNDISNINLNNFEFDFIPISLKNNNQNIDLRALSLFLLSKCKHFITIPSTFSWWGAWLSRNENKVIFRPNSDFFSDFYINNIDFWPKNWLSISKKE